MADGLVLDAEVPPGLLLVSAFLAMEPADHVISLARECGGGKVTERVQSFVWDHCLCQTAGNFRGPYLKNFLKKLISEVESSRGDVLDELYELYAHYMTCMKDGTLVKGDISTCKGISFLFPDGNFELPSCPKSRKLVVQLQCSLNILEGDTGCSIWPSSLFLSEVILSFPEIFSRRTCLEVGSGVGLVGICLTHVKASKVVLTDGDLSALANMKINLDLNHIVTGKDVSAGTVEHSTVVECIHLPWESTSESELRDFIPDILLGADVIYDPACLPHLVRVIAVLLDHMKSRPQKKIDLSDKSFSSNNHADGTVSGIDKENANSDGHCYYASQSNTNFTCVQNGQVGKGPVAYIASVIRNAVTFSRFLALAEQANLTIADINETLRPMNLLPFMHSYNRSEIRLFVITLKYVDGTQVLD